MNHAPWKTPRVRPGHALVLSLALLLAAACSTDSGRPSSGGRPDVGGQPETSGGQDTVQPPVDVPVDTPAEVTPTPDTTADADAAGEVTPTAPEVTVTTPTDGAAIPRQQPLVFRIEAAHAAGIAQLALRWEDDVLEVRDLTNDGVDAPAESGTFEFALDQYFVPDGQPLPAANGADRRYPRDGDYRVTFGAQSGEGVWGFARVDIHVDGGAPTLILRDSPADRGLEVLDVVGQVRVAFRAEDEHELKESRVRLSWEVDGEPREVLRTLVPTTTSEYIVVFEVEDTVDRADLRIVAEDTAGNVRTVEWPVRIIGRPPYRLGHVFEFPNGAEILGYALGHYDDSDAYPDLWVSTTDGLWLLLGTADGEFQGGFKLLDPLQPAPTKIQLHDFDRDGLEDLFLMAPDGGALTTSVAIRMPAAVEGTIDRYRVYPGIVVPDGTEAATLAYIDDELNPDGTPRGPENAVIDLVVGLSDPEDSVGVLLGRPVGDLPLAGVPDPLAPGADCDPACPSFMACHNGRCVLESSDRCDPPCGATGICLQPNEEVGYICYDLQDEDVCGGCEPGERCFDGACRRVMTNDCDPACADVYTCLFGECVLLDTEDCDPACADGEICHNGVCVLRYGGDCDPECGARQVCQFGTCVGADRVVCDPPCWGGDLCHVVNVGGQEQGRCVRRCDESGCGGVSDEPPFFDRPHFLRGVAGITDLKVADFNGDGYLDIVVGRTGVRQISCYLNKGAPAGPGEVAGDFLDAYDTYLDDNPVVVHPIRFNASGEDGDMDLLVATETRPRLFVLEGEGNGFFRTLDEMGDEEDHIFFAGPISDFADIEAFTDRDLVTLEPGGSILRLFRYNQSTSPDGVRFLGQSVFSTGIDPGQLRTADMNADEVADVVYVNQGTGRLVVGLGLGVPREDFDLPPELLLTIPPKDLICPGDPDCKLNREWQIVDIAAAPLKNDSFDTDDLLILMTGPLNVAWDPVPFGLDAPPECGGAATASYGQHAVLRLVASDGKRPARPNHWTMLNALFSTRPSAMTLGRFDGDLGLDVAVAFDRDPPNWLVARLCICEEQGDEIVCRPDEESNERVYQPNVAILRNRRDGSFAHYAEPQLQEMVDVSIAPLGFAALPEPDEIRGDLGNYLPDTEEGFLGYQLPIGLVAQDVTGDTIDDLFVVSDEQSSPPDLSRQRECADVACGDGEGCFYGECIEKYAPPQLTIWRAPSDESGVFRGPRFGVTIGRAPTDWTFIQATPTVDTVMDLLIANQGDDDLTLLEATGAASFRTPRYLATASTPTGIFATQLERTGDAGSDDDFDDFVISVDGNVQIGYGRRPDGTSRWAFDDVVYLYPGGTYPREDPRGVHSYDFNRDGVQDILVANAGSDTATIFFGVGDRLFPAYLDVNTGHDPQRLRIADFNQDGCKDFAIANQQSQSVTLLLSLTDDCPD